MGTILRTVVASTLVFFGILIFPIQMKGSKISTLYNNVKGLPVACTQIRMIGIDVQKNRLDNDELIRTVELDTLTIADFSSKSIVVKSARFGFLYVFFGNCQYSQKTFKSTTNKGSEHIGVRDIFTFKNGQGIVYIRPSGKVITPYLFVGNEGFMYTYKLAYAEVYNSKYKKWERVDVLGVNADSDPVLYFLKSHVAK